MQAPQKPLPDHLQDFLDWLDVEKGLASRSQENYANFLRRFFSWLQGRGMSDKTPRDLTEEHIRQYRLFLSRGEELKKSTQNYYLIALRSFLTFFAEHGIEALSPDKVKLAREKEDRQIRFLSLEQIQQLLDAPDTTTLHGLRDRAILETFFSTGLRLSELVALDRDQVRLPANLSEELEVTVTGKGGRVRTVYFSERSLGWLGRYLAARNDNDDALFVTYRSERKRSGVRRIGVRMIQTMIKRCAVKAGLPYQIITPHIMRHSFATDLLAQGVDIRTLQEFLGHKNIAATQLYAHLTSKQLRDIHKKFHGGKTLRITEFE